MNDIAKAILFVRHDRFPDMSEGKFRQNILKIDHKTWEKIKRLGFARQDTKDKVRDRLKEACPDLDTSFFDYSGKEPLNMPRGSSGLEEPKQDYKSSPEGGSAYLTLVTAVRKHLAGLDPEEMSTMEQAAMNYISEIYREHKSRKKALEAAEAIALEMDGLDMAFAEDSEIIRREKKLKEMCEIFNATVSARPVVSMPVVSRSAKQENNSQAEKTGGANKKQKVSNSS